VTIDCLKRGTIKSKKLSTHHHQDMELYGWIHCKLYVRAVFKQRYYGDGCVGADTDSRCKRPLASSSYKDKAPPIKVCTMDSCQELPGPRHLCWRCPHSRLRDMKRRRFILKADTGTLSKQHLQRCHSFLAFPV
jgi:hypothetical protein